MHSIRKLHVLSLLLGAVLVPAISLAAAGGLDSNFNQGGVVTVSSLNAAAHIDVDAAGNIVATSSSKMATVTECIIARFTPGGSLDVSFDGDGLLNIIPYVPADPFDCIARVQTMGGMSKIVVLQRNGEAGDLSRYNADGSRDQTFNAAATLNFAPLSFSFAADASIMVVGRHDSDGLDIARFNADGTPMLSFGGTGQVSMNVGNGFYDDRIIEQDGKILVLDNSGPNGVVHPALYRFNADGSLDAGFINGPRLADPFDPAKTYSINEIKLQNVGAERKILIMGVYYGGTPYQQDSAYLARFNADGTIDPSFGTGGFLTVSARGARSLVTQGDGKIVFVGRNALDQGVIVRYLQNGVVDPSFGTAGSVVVPDGALGVSDPIEALMDSRGRLVVGGGSTSNSIFTIARYLGDPLYVSPPPLPTSLGSVSQHPTKPTPPWKAWSRFLKR